RTEEPKAEEHPQAPPTLRACCSAGSACRLHGAARCSYASLPFSPLGAYPAARGDIDHLVVRPPVLDLIIGARVRCRGVTQLHPPHGGLGACLLQLFTGLVHIVHQETEMVDAGVTRHVPGAVTGALD